MANSMLDYLDLEDDVGEFKIARQNSTKVFIYVEGESDYNFFEMRINKEEAEVNIVNGRDRVVKMIKEFNQNRTRFMLGIVDKDFWGIADQAENIDNLIYSDEFENLETLLIHGLCFKKIIISNCDRAKIKAFDYDELRRMILREAGKVFTYRLINEIEQIINVNFKRLDIPSVFDHNSGQLRDEDLREAIFALRSSKRFTKEFFIERYNTLRSNYDLEYKGQGHDISTIFGLYFSKLIGTREINRRDIEKKMIESYEWTCFIKTDLYRKIIKWQNANERKILDYVI